MAKVWIKARRARIEQLLESINEWKGFPNNQADTYTQIVHEVGFSYMVIEPHILGRRYETHLKEIGDLKERYENKGETLIP